MKNLQNHIFSTTTCISKETMLKFINKQLSQKELHEVQKHLIDCDFCSEALEGLKYAKNSSILFNIDHKITARTEQKTIPFARIILVAASVLFIAVGGYYTINSFNDASKLKENEISFQEPQKNTIENILPAQEELLQEQKKVEGDKITVVEKNRYETKAEEKASGYYRFEDEKNKDGDVSKKEVQGYVSQQTVSPNTITSSTGSTYKTELAESDDALMDIETKVTQDKTVLKESRVEYGTKSDANFDQLAKNQAPNKVIKTENAKKTNDNKQRAKKATEAPSAVPATDELKNSTDKEAEDLLVPEEYIRAESLEKEADLRNDNNSTNQTISFSEASGGLPTGSTTNSRTALTDGIADFNAKKYTSAIQNFDLILAETPTTTKTYEAKWYKALCLIEIKDITAAKKLLNELTYVNNPFSKNAEDKLKEME